LTEILQKAERDRFAPAREPGSQDAHGDLKLVVGGQYQLISNEDRVLLRQLAIFVGGVFEADALEVCCPESHRTVTDGILRLRNFSLIEPRILGERTRYRILDTIREFLAVTTPEEEAVESLSACHGRHAAHYSALAGEIRDLLQAGRWTEG